MQKYYIQVVLQSGVTMRAALSGTDATFDDRLNPSLNGVRVHNIRYWHKQRWWKKGFWACYGAGVLPYSACAGAIHTISEEVFDNSSSPGQFAMT